MSSGGAGAGSGAGVAGAGAVAQEVSTRVSRADRVP